MHVTYPKTHRGTGSSTNQQIECITECITETQWRQSHAHASQYFKHTATIGSTPFCSCPCLCPLASFLSFPSFSRNPPHPSCRPSCWVPLRPDPARRPLKHLQRLPLQSAQMQCPLLPRCLQQPLCIVLACHMLQPRGNTTRSQPLTIIYDRTQTPSGHACCRGERATGSACMHTAC